MTRNARRVDYVLAACRDKRVLHLGCADHPQTVAKLADGALLHERMRDVARDLYGIDAAAAGIRALRAAGFENLATADIETLGDGRPFEDVEFDLVVAGEVIEHLSNPGLFLDGVKHYLRDSSRLLLTTPNAYCAHRFVYALLRGNESANVDHTMYFSRRTLLRLADTHGYAVCDVCFYGAEEYEAHLNRGRYRLLWWADRLATHVRPMLAEGVIAVLATNEAVVFQR